MKIKLKIYEGDNIDFLADLCNQLMTFQGERATIRQDVMKSMNYENRLKPEYANTKRKHMLVAYDENTPIGFAFSIVTTVTKAVADHKAAWAESLGGIGFYPVDYDMPKIVGTFRLLIVDEKYRSHNIGKQLAEEAMTWLRSQKDAEDLWVYVANGNEIVGKFYEALGFNFSHEVYKGFIKAYRMSNQL
ncbi:MAG: GNAT family N-acetyltransferase [Clostridia bacterium]|nr:GNAT family N-acetyltransferase [Clostridia bacterium]